MLITKKISYGVILLFITNIFVQNSVAQTSPHNTNQPNITIIADSSNQLLAYGTIPANSIYQGQWDNNFIKVYKNLLPNKPDSTLILFSGVENVFTVPVIDGVIISQFGFRGSRIHSGVDIRQKTGNPVVAAFDGKIRVAKYSKGYGNTVVVRHYNGLETLYAHLSKIKVKVNDDVKSGELIGLAGSTGTATASHLHFETRYLGEAFNPEKIIDFEHNKLRQDSFEIKANTFTIDQNARLNGVVPNTPATEYKSNNTKKAVSSKSSHHSKSSRHSKSGRHKKGLYHTIGKGDTLYSLAKKNNTTVESICKLNHIKVKSKLPIGKKIRIK